MHRINVLGNAGVGKSTLAAQMARKLDLPVIAVDSVLMKPWWQWASKEEEYRMMSRLCAEPKWIIDGPSHKAREMADVIVFLDYPRHISLWRVAKRNWRYLFWSRPEMPPNCPEILMVFRLMRIIWTFPYTKRETWLAQFEEWKHTKRIVHIRSDRELEAFLNDLQPVS
jgi:adenylate kinase family enzyme